MASRRFLLRAKSLRSTFFTLATVLVVPSAFAHSIDDPKALHGGQAVAAGSYHLELLVNDAEVQLYLYDKHNAPLWADSVKVAATIWTAAGATEVALQPSKRNLLTAPSPIPAADILKITVQFSDEYGKPVQGWFPFTKTEQ